MRLCAAVLCAAVLSACGGASSSGDAKPRPVDHFDAGAAYTWVKRQLAYGPRPAGSPQLYRLAAKLKAALPHGRYEAVPRGLRNVVGTVPGRDPSRYVVVGAHYDTKDAPGFVGANDAAAPTAVALELARTLKPRQARPTVVFVLFDGEESPGDTPDSQFLQKGLRGSKVAARAYSKAEAMILLDFVGQHGLQLPREGFSDPTLWAKLRTAAQDVGQGSFFPSSTEDSIYDDHYPFLKRGVPAIDLIDWPYRCYHVTCDDLSQISSRSLDATGESVLELLRTL
ncbi:MAG: M28 family metallopeptidase [Thermoleophilaceae bacterium]